MTPRTSIRFGMITVCAAVAVALTGCTASAVHSTGSPSSVTAPTHTPAGGVVADVKNQPGSQKSYVGALKDVTVKNCSTDTDPARYDGVVKNPTDSKQSYRIYVSILAGTTTLGIDQVDVPAVAANSTKTWSGSLKVSNKNARCVLRVERTTDE